MGKRGKNSIVHATIVLEIFQAQIRLIRTDCAWENYDGGFVIIFDKGPVLPVQRRPLPIYPRSNRSLSKKKI